MKNHFGRFTFVLLIAAVCIWLTWSKGIKLGLDLAGGSSLTYTASSEGDLDKKKLDKAIEVITKRVNATGLTEIYITSTSSGEIVVEMPRRTKDEILAIKALIERNGQLEFRIREDSKTETDARAEREANPVLYRPRPDQRWIPWSASESRAQSSQDVLVKIPEGPAQKKYDELLASKGEEDEATKQAARELRDVIAAEVFRGEDLEKTELTTQGAAIVVAFEFKDHRKSDFGAFTRRNVGKQMAIVLDGKVSSDPVIRSELPGRGIIEGGGSGFKESEANELRITLESGSTGVRLSLSREETLGASLGDVAVERGKWSIVVSFVVVFLLVLWFYRLPGLIANLALFLNVLMILGAMAFFRGALSLPGIAGIVLTLGMAVDANILIFERLRDERARGKSLAESLAAGYDNAFSAIIDTHVTTILTALVLVWIGTGAVRGFGVTLTIGLVASLFTAVWVTRVIFEWLLDRKLISAFNIGPDPKDPQIDYMKHRMWFTGPTLVLMALGTVGFLLRDEADSKDLEFIGGQQVIIQLKEAITGDELNAKIKGENNEWESATAVELAPAGVDTSRGGTNRWQIRAKAGSEAKGREYVDYLRRTFSDKFVAPPYENWIDTPAAPGAKATSSLLVHTLSEVTDTAKLKSALESKGMTGVEVVRPEGSDGRVYRLKADTPDGGEAVVKENVRKALLSLEPPVQLSDPTPSVSYLSPSQAEKLWRMALQALFVGLAVQVVYIRVRFADYTHGFAAAFALIHDVAITLGAVALFDSLGWVYAKVNLVLVAAFLTLIGYSMNDTIVVFDRMRENLGRSKVIRSRLINESINQTFVRSIRTSLTVFATVVVQFIFNHGIGSVLEGFAWVMIVGAISGTYSSIFIAAPMLLFLPGYGRKLTSNRVRFAAIGIATLAGSLVAVTATGHGLQFWVGIALASTIVIHFLAHFVPWLTHPDPDELVLEEPGNREADLPLESPGV